MKNHYRGIETNTPIVAWPTGSKVWHKQSIRRYLKIWLVCLALCLATHGNAATKKVLFYGPTHVPGGVAENLVNNNPAEFAPVGQGSDVWTPGDPNPAKDWNKKTTADFAAFDAVFIGEPGAPSVNPIVLTGAIINSAIWTPAISGNVIIISGDPQFHVNNPPGFPGAQEYIEQGLRFAAEHAAAGPGLYVASGLLDFPRESPVDPNKDALAHLLEGFGQFETIAPAFGAKVVKIGSHPTLDCVTALELSDWGSSAHDGFADWPASFAPLALVTDVQPQNETPPSKLPPGYRGMVHILVKASLKQFLVSPLIACKFIGEQHTVTATYLNETGGGISGAQVTFDIIDGPNANLGPVVRTTDVNGNATWTYTGSGGAGTDTIEAVVTASGCAPVARATAHWSSQMVTISATDPNAAEPATPGGAPNTGTFVLTRSASPPSEIDQPLTVTIAVSGTAEQGTDYDLNDPFGPVFTTVFFDAGVTAVTLTVEPLFDPLSELPESVIVQLVQLPSCPYVTGSPSEATVTITSVHATVTLALFDDNTDESSNNSGELRLNRTYTVGDLPVELGFTGTATFGADYVISGVDGVGTVIMPDGVAMLSLLFLPIPDSRAEGSPGESATVTVLPSSQGVYSVGTPSAQSITITEDDTNQLPLNGWALTDLGASGMYGNGINTLPDGAGGWRGQVVGHGASTYNSFRWYNGSSTTLYPPAGWYSPWCVAISINDASTTVGYAGQVYGSTYVYPAYWRVNQIYASTLSVLYTYLGTDNAATDINQRNDLNGTGGVIVGNNRTVNGKVHAVTWIPDGAGNYGAVTDLSDTGGGTRYSYAGAINNQGVVVGQSQIDAGNNYHAFRSQASSLLPQPLFAPTDDMGTATFVDAHASAGNDINDLGEMVGASDSPSGQYHAVYKSPFSVKNVGFYDLGVLGQGTANAGDRSYALAISAKGLIVGQSKLKVGSLMLLRAFVVSNQGNPGSQPMLNLAEQAWVWTGMQWQRADANGWVLTSAERANREGWIVGYGTKSGQTRAFVLSPRQ